MGLEKYSGKKGMEAFTLVGIIIAVAAIVASSIFVANTKRGVDEITSDRVCNTAITTAAQSKIATGKPAENLPGIGKCERETLMIKKSEIVGSDGYISQDAASKKISDFMGRKWGVVGEGKIDPFSNWGEDGITHCAVLGAIKFDDELKEMYKKVDFENPNPELIEKYTIKSPIVYMLTHKVRENGPTYFEYLYNENSRGLGLTNEVKEALDMSVITEGSLILVRMYKKETKSTVMAYAQGAVPIVFAVAGGIAVIALIPTGAGVVLAASIIAGGAIGAGSIATVISTATIGYPSEEVFRDCKECNALGGMMLVPTEQSLNAVIPTTIKDEGGERMLKIKVCDNLVN